jgi:hypothetical protein
VILFNVGNGYVGKTLLKHNYSGHPSLLMTIASLICDYHVTKMSLRA